MTWALVDLSAPKKPRKRRTPGTGSIYLRGGIWYLQYSVGGKQIQESSHSHIRSDAMNLLRIRLGDAASGRHPYGFARGLTIADVCKLTLNDQRLHNKADVKGTEYRINKHLDRLLGKFRAWEFGTKHVSEYILVRRKEGATDGTINRELSILRRGFRLGTTAEPPLVLRCPKVVRLVEHNTRQGFLEPEQYQAVLAALPERLKALFIVGYHVGARKGELLSLRWDQVDLEAGTIRLSERQTKNKTGRVLPIYGPMAAALRAQRERVPGDRVFPLGRHIAGWDEACAAAGVPGLLFHDLRRSAVRNMERAGVPRKVAMGITGHLTEAVYRRYDIVSERDLASAGRVMEQYMAGTGINCTKLTPGEEVAGK